MSKTAPFDSRANAASGEIGTRQVAAAIIGNALEFFDFTSYAIFAVYIGRAFFPNQSGFVSLLLSVATFGVGFITRPLGAVLIGAYADRAGRKPAMTLTIVMMALGTGMIGVLPTYADIGIAAPVLLVLARTIQGFSTGGEMGPATSYLVESAPPHRRGFFGSWQSASQGMASLATGIVSFILAQTVSTDAIQAWGWRVPFLLGLLILPVGLYIRASIDETLDVGSAPKTNRAVLGEVFRRHWGKLVYGTLMIAGGTVMTYFQLYMTSYALDALHLSASVALFAPLLLGAIGIGGAVFGGWLADRTDAMRVVLVPRVVLVLIAYPALIWTARASGPVTFLVIAGTLALIQNISAGVSIVYLQQSFPAAIRTTGLSIAYALAVTIFGATAQPIFTWLIEASGHNAVAPSWYLVLTGVLSVIGIVGLHRASQNPGPTRAS